MLLEKVRIPNFLYSELAQVVQPGVRQPSTIDYVAALMYDPRTGGLLLDKEREQPYHTFLGGLVEPGDLSLLAAMYRELTEELPSDSIVRLNEKGPVATIAYPKTESSHEQHIHIFAGVADLVPGLVPSIPAWVIQESTGYMVNHDVQKTITGIFEREFPKVAKPAIMGGSQYVVVNHNGNLAQLNVVRELQ